MGPRVRLKEGGKGLENWAARAYLLFMLPLYSFRSPINPAATNPVMPDVYFSSFLLFAPVLNLHPGHYHQAGSGQRLLRSEAVEGTSRRLRDQSLARPCCLQSRLRPRREALLLGLRPHWGF